MIEIYFLLNRNENHLYLFFLHLISSILFVYLLNKSRRYYILPIIVLIYRWNLFGFVDLFSVSLIDRFCFSWLSSLTPLLYYGLLIFLFFMNELSIENVLFAFLYMICRPHNCFLIIVHMIFDRYLNVTDARLAFLLSQSAFFHLVRILNF